MAYVSVDGRLFMDEKTCSEHEDDLIGQELDLFFKITKMRESCGHSAIYTACLNALKSKEQLKQLCKTIVTILEHSENE